MFGGFKEIAYFCSIIPKTRAYDDQPLAQNPDVYRRCCGGFILICTNAAV